MGSLTSLGMVLTGIGIFNPCNDQIVAENIISNYEYSESVYNASSYKQVLIKEILGFTLLPNNWDGYGAIPLQKRNFDNANKLIEALDENFINNISDFFPNPNGTLSFIWENENSDRISLEIGGDTFSYYYKPQNEVAQIHNQNKFDTSSYYILNQLIGEIV